jgi:hypothetical protein
MDEHRPTQMNSEEDHLEYIYHGSPSDYFNTRMSIETYVMAKEEDSERFTITSEENTIAQQDCGQCLEATTLAVQPSKPELYQDIQSTNDKEPYNDHGRALPLKQFIIVYTGYTFMLLLTFYHLDFNLRHTDAFTIHFRLSMAIFLSALDQTM